MSEALRWRLLSSLLLAPLVLAAIVLGMPWTGLLLLVIVVVLAWEWTTLTQGRFSLRAGLLLIASLVLAVVLASQQLWLWSLPVLLVGGALAAALAPAPQLARRKPIWMLGGSLYIGLASLALYYLREDRPAGLDWTLWLLAIVWAVDVFAYLVGSRVGGWKLWPSVSPRKTWSGFLGGTLAGILVGLCGAFWLEDRSLWELGLGAGLLGLIAQAGDLAESAVKRHFQVKDASALIPGHGGLLDRVDGLLPASIALAVALWLGA